MATTQYNYTDPGNSTNSATVANLNATTTTVTGSFGARLRLINAKSFKLFVGGGLIFGGLWLSTSEQDFKDKTGNSNGYKDIDTSSIAGNYFDAGAEYRWNDKNGLRLIAKKNAFSSTKFKTLGDKKVISTFYQCGVYYVHIVDFSFFWK